MLNGGDAAVVALGQSIPASKAEEGASCANSQTLLGSRTTSISPVVFGMGARAGTEEAGEPFSPWD
jgi:hypothetical protein